jgi:aspartate aminotransferase-like enzyme
MRLDDQLIMTPGPTNVPSRIMQAMTKPMINHRGPEFESLYEKIAQNLKKTFETKNDVYPLSSSGTGGVECAVSNTISPGDKAIVVVNGEFSRRLRDMIKSHGAEVTELNAEDGHAPSRDEIDSVLEKQQNARAFFIVYNETSTGVTLRELDHIGKVLKGRDTLFVVDAISILGGDYLHTDDWNVDICITGSQKCLACPPGLALISINEKAMKVAEKNHNPRFYFDLVKIRKYHQDNSTPSTPNLPLFYALDEALQLLVEEGLTQRIERHNQHAQQFYDGLEEMGLQILPEPKLRSKTVIAVKNPPGIEDKKIRDLLNQKYGVVIAGGMGSTKGKIFRVGCMGVISDREVITTLRALELTLNELGYKPQESTHIISN